MTPGFQELKTPRQIHRHNLRAVSDTSITIATVDNLIGAESGGSTRAQSLLIVFLDITFSGAGTIIFRSGASEVGRIVRSADLLVAHYDWNPDGWFDTGDPSTPFSIDNSTNTLTLDGVIGYVKL